MMLCSVYSIMTGFITFTVGMILVAFYILSERKILGYMQLRKGPKKVGLLGLLQSFADLAKLLLKFSVGLFQGRSWFSWCGISFLTAACAGFCSMVSSGCSGLSGETSLVWCLLVSSLSGYSVLCVGWGSYNKYAMLSAVRCCFGAVSFEALFMCMVVQSCCIMGDYKMGSLGEESWLMFLVCPVLFWLWAAGLVMECGRTPFDYLEAESEMVSGINVEFGCLPFTCLFACEYFIMFAKSWISSTLFFSGYLVAPGTALTLYLYIWCRGTFPRARYDFFVKLMWEWGILTAVFCFVMFI